jgi:hypothetical protein
MTYLRDILEDFKETSVEYVEGADGTRYKSQGEAQYDWEIY